MTETTTDKKDSIDRAIDNCQSTIRGHKIQSLFFLMLLIAIPLFVGSLFLIDTNRQYEAKYRILSIATDSNIKANLSSNTMESIENNTSYILYGISILVFGVFTSFYRFHLKEISKYEHYMFGFIRIKIAGNNSKYGYDTEVRKSLTNEAFSHELKSSFMNKEKKVESPMPGHPTLDLSSAIINKVIDSLDVIIKKKK